MDDFIRHMFGLIWTNRNNVLREQGPLLFNLLYPQYLVPQGIRGLNYIHLVDSGWLDGWMDEWIAGWMDGGWMDDEW